LDPPLPYSRIFAFKGVAHPPHVQLAGRIEFKRWVFHTGGAAAGHADWESSTRSVSTLSNCSFPLDPNKRLIRPFSRKDRVIEALREVELAGPPFDLCPPLNAVKRREAPRPQVFPQPILYREDLASHENPSALALLPPSRDLAGTPPGP